MYRQAESPQTAHLWIKAAFFWTVPITILFHFTLVFTGRLKSSKNKLILILLYAPAVVFSFFELTTDLISTGPPIKEYWGYTYTVAQDSLLYNLSNIWLFTILISTVILCIRYYFKVTDIRIKRQAKYVAIGYFVSVLVGLLTERILPMFKIKLPELTITTINLQNSFIAYAIWKYNLFILNPATAAENIISVMPDALILFDVSGKILTVNKFLLTLLGYKKEELIAQQVDMLFADEYFRNKIFQGSLKDKTIENYETRYKAKSHQEISVSFSSSLVYGREGEIVGVVAVATDITERKEIEGNLRESERRFRHIAEASGEWIWEVDVYGRYTYSNLVVEHVLGYSPEEIQGKYYYDFFTPEERNILVPQVKVLFEKKANFHNLPNRNLHKDGREVIIETTAVPILDAEGKLQGYRGVDHDVTERKRAEEKLKVAYDQLKTTQVRLVQSAKMASVGLLAGGVAHEINNPLTGVLNNVQLIRMIAEQKQDFNIADFKELLTVIEGSALRCKRITQSLLDFSRASKDVFQKLSLNEIVEKVATLIEHELGLQNIAIQKDLEPGLPQVLGDSQLLQQVVFDVISNGKWAIQQKSEKEGGTIALKTQYEPEKKNILLSISDNGIGIAKENLEKVFEPFFTTKEVGEGTGLGLSIAYSIIKAHQGTIEAESEPGKWTIFKIRLPVIS